MLVEAAEGPPSGGCLCSAVVVLANLLGQCCRAVVLSHDCMVDALIRALRGALAQNSTVLSLQGFCVLYVGFLCMPLMSGIHKAGVELTIGVGVVFKTLAQQTLRHCFGATQTTARKRAYGCLHRHPYLQTSRG